LLGFVDFGIAAAMAEAVVFGSATVSKCFAVVAFAWAAFLDHPLNNKAGDFSSGWC